MMTQRTTLLAGATAGGLAVALGAIGAHALKPMLVASNHLDTYETAVRYHLYHALVLLVIGILMERFPKKTLPWAATFILGGILLFSGSLYVLALTSFRAAAFLTPVGGVFLLVGWGLLFCAVASSPACAEASGRPAPSSGEKG